MQSRRRFIKQTGMASATLLVPASQLYAKTFLTVKQAQQILLPNLELKPSDVTLSEEQAKEIKRQSKVRVRNSKLQAWKSDGNDWFIVDQIIGKHENIDMAFAFNSQGKVIGFEILTYRESYGHEIRHPKWRAQFEGKDHSEHLKLDRQIKNISGATLSCRHVTDGINRLAHTWHLVLQHS